MAGSKSTQTTLNFVGQKHLLYIPSLAFLDYYAPINVDVFVKCGMWETFRLFSGCLNGSGWSVLIQLHYFCTPQKASVGMCSRCLCLTSNPAHKTQVNVYYIIYI